MTIQRNREVREAAANSGIQLWMIAEAFGVQDSTFSRWLRKEFTRERKASVLQIIQELQKGGKSSDKEDENA